MKTIAGYILGFSMTFTVIAGGMFFLSESYPWMFGASGAEKGDGRLNPTVSVPSAPDVPGVVGTSRDSSGSAEETISTLKHILAAKNDSIEVKNDSIQVLNSEVAQLRQKNSDATGMITQLQAQVESWTSQRKKDMASTYNDLEPASAARIMKNLGDNDVIFILSNVQKKQAAKILGELDPARAARLMTILGKAR